MHLTFEHEPGVVDRARGGDRDAYEQLARTTADRLYPVASRILRDHDLATDAVQQTLVQIWRTLPALKDAAKFDAWAYRILVRICTHELKGKNRFHGDVYALQLPGKVGESTTHIRLRDEIARGFVRLSAEQRAIVVLVYYEGRSTAEVSELLAIPPGTVASRLHYALRTLRAAVEADRRLGAGGPQ